MMNSTSSPDPYRNLIVHGLNQAITEGSLSLVRNPNYVELKRNGGRDPETSHIKTLIGGRPSVVIWSDLGHEEIRLTVWWKYSHEQHPRSDEERFVSRTPLCKSTRLKDFLGVACTADLEREKGPHIMGEGKKHISSIYTRKGELEHLKRLPTAKSLGYSVTGKFYV